MKKLFITFLLIGTTLTTFSQDQKVYNYSSDELIQKPSPTPDFVKWIAENNEKVGHSAPHSTKKTSKVTLVFVVDGEGNIINPKIWRGIGQGYDQYAFNLI